MRIFREILFFVRIMLFSYVVSLLLLGILAFAAYKADFGEHVITGAIIGIYFLSSFIGGMLAGKVKKHRRLIWGLLIGSLYVAGLLTVSLIMGRGISMGTETMIALAAAIAGGVFGGMIS